MRCWFGIPPQRRSLRLQFFGKGTSEIVHTQGNTQDPALSNFGFALIAVGALVRVSSCDQRRGQVRGAMRPSAKIVLVIGVELLMPVVTHIGIVLISLATVLMIWKSTTQVFRAMLRLATSWQRLCIAKHRNEFFVKILFPCLQSGKRWEWFVRVDRDSRWTRERNSGGLTLSRSTLLLALV